MFGWLINIILFVLILVVSLNNKKMATPQRRRLFIFLSTLQLLSIQLLKDTSLLPDASTYRYYYENYTTGLYDNFEPGFRTFVVFLRQISPKFYMFILAYGIIQVATHVWVINKYSTNLLFTYILFIATSFYALFIVRQYLAIAFCLISIPFILNRNIILFLLCTALAVSFHTSAAIWIITYFLYRIDFSKPIRTWIVFCAAIIFVYYGIDQYFSYVLMGFSRFEYYITDTEEQYTWKTLAVSLSTVIFAIFCYGKKIKTICGSQKLFFILAWVVVFIDLINFLGTSFSAMYRLSPYFTISTSFLIPDAVSYLRKGTRMIAVPLIILLYVWLLIASINQQRGFGFII